MSKQVTGRDDPQFRQVDSFEQYGNVDLARTYGFVQRQ